MLTIAYLNTVLNVFTYLLPYLTFCWCCFYRAALLVDEDDLSSVVDILRSVSVSRITSLRHQVEFFWRSYFSSLRSITITTLQIINDRVFPYTALKYEDWNDPPTSVSNLIFSHSLYPLKFKGTSSQYVTRHPGQLSLLPSMGC